MSNKEVLTPRPCLTPFICMAKLDTTFRPNLTKKCISRSNIVTQITMFSLTPIFFILNHMPSLSTLSNSSSESTKHRYIQPLFVHTCFNCRNITLFFELQHIPPEEQSDHDNTVASLVSCHLVFLNIYSPKLVIMTHVSKCLGSP